MKEKEAAPLAGDALVAVDLQVDFIAGGALAVPGGEGIIPVFNSYLALFHSRNLPVVLTRDWHPRGHVSFLGRGGDWPPHCVQGTAGGLFAPGLALTGSETVVSKAEEREADSYSAFEDPDFAGRLRAGGVRRLFIGGLATDYCVRSTVVDALESRFAVFLLVDAIRAVDVNEGDGDRAVAEMLAKGARPVRYRETAD